MPPPRSGARLIIKLENTPFAAGLLSLLTLTGEYLNIFDYVSAVLREICGARRRMTRSSPFSCMNLKTVVFLCTSAGTNTKSDPVQQRKEMKKHDEKKRRKHNKNIERGPFVVRLLRASLHKLASL
ncbi:hypothetical protein AMECASPLE_001776 [Ameca splendens]|uniref:Uncharacterized protein n=1 Tax=Ameca splendens TaxID=208324 RepID=A0ABV0XXW7_9TELE